MGAAVGARLVQHGVEVRTSLAGRSADTGARAAKAGMAARDDAAIAAADFILSIVPPAQALPLAQRLAPALRASTRKAVYVDCNAVSPRTVGRIAEAIAPTGCPFVGAGIIGGPPQPERKGPAFYAAGPDAPRFAALADHGLDVRVLDGPLTAASALKMAYGGITKGVTALGAAMLLAATRGGSAEALRRELASSQPELLAWFTRQISGMYPKAYRWVAEMEEVAAFAGDGVETGAIYAAIAEFYQHMARDFAGERKDTEALKAFLGKM
jgi:3-hydroxyisobutyrate dehydrogenase-like beta-hydroxyacid dehydrogenase